MAHLAIGPFFKDLKANLEENLSKPSGKKISLFSGHDSTIAPILGGFRVFDMKFPRFGAMVLLV